MSENRNNVLVENRSVMICLPWYKQTNPRTAFALLSMYDRRRMAISLDFGDACVFHSRNKLADQFLKSKQEWSLWLDDDNLPPFGSASLYNSFTGFNLPEHFAGLHGIDQLLSRGKTFIGGVYRGRWPHHSNPVFAEGPRLNKWVSEGPKDEVRATEWIGYGFVLVHRSVFLDIERAFPHLARKQDGTGGQWFTPSQHDLTNAAEEIISSINSDCPMDSEEISKKLEGAIRLSRRNSGLGTGEDVQMARRAAQAGHNCHVDLSLHVGHFGELCYLPGKTKIQ